MAMVVAGARLSILVLLLEFGDATALLAPGLGRAALLGKVSRARARRQRVRRSEERDGGGDEPQGHEDISQKISVSKDRAAFLCVPCRADESDGRHAASVNPAHLRVWDPNRRLCSGYLFKKGGGRNWNKRLCVDLDSRATTTPSSGTTRSTRRRRPRTRGHGVAQAASSAAQHGAGYEFQIKPVAPDRADMELYAEAARARALGPSLAHLIEVANARATASPRARPRTRARRQPDGQRRRRGGGGGGGQADYGAIAAGGGGGGGDAGDFEAENGQLDAVLVFRRRRIAPRRRGERLAAPSWP